MKIDSSLMFEPAQVAAMAVLVKNRDWDGIKKRREKPFVVAYLAVKIFKLSIL